MREGQCQILAVRKTSADGGGVVGWDARMTNSRVLYLYLNLFASLGSKSFLVDVHHRREMTNRRGWPLHARTEPRACEGVRLDFSQPQSSTSHARSELTLAQDASIQLQDVVGQPAEAGVATASRSSTILLRDSRPLSTARAVRCRLRGRRTGRLVSPLRFTIQCLHEGPQGRPHRRPRPNDLTPIKWAGCLLQSLFFPHARLTTILTSD